MANPDQPPTKPAQRLAARQALDAASREWRQETSRRLCEAVGAWLHTLPRVRRVATFAALPDEPDLAALHRPRGGIEWSYPLVHADDRLTFHHVPDPGTLREGHFGIREPDPSVHPETPVGALDVILCPGLAFARSGVRLGRGKGHYDRVLAQAAGDTPRVGVGFFAGEHDDLPADPHDIPMTHLATPDGVVAV